METLSQTTPLSFSCDAQKQNPKSQVGEQSKADYDILDGLRRAREATETKHSSEHLKPKRKHTPKILQLRLDSMTRVNPNTRIHSLGCWNNPREVFSVRVDKGLAKAFTKVAKAKYGSTCRAIEAYMVAELTAVKAEQLADRVYPSNTVNIAEIKIERNLRERRKLTKTVTIEEETETTESTKKCVYKGCKGEPVGKAVWLATDAESPLCVDHLDVAYQNRHLWKVLK